LSITPVYAAAVISLIDMIKKGKMKIYIRHFSMTIIFSHQLRNPVMLVIAMLTIHMAGLRSGNRPYACASLADCGFKGSLRLIETLTSIP
jgi:hypothetical protein